MQADELWHFYAGAPLELVAYTPTTRVVERQVLGHVGEGSLGAPAAAPSGTVSVSIIPTGVWQAARSLGEYSLVGCTVGPGFEFADFQFVSELPSHADHFKGDLAPFADLL